MTASGSIHFVCEACRREFPADAGGTCGRCGRTLCGIHLHGWLGGSLLPWRRWLPGDPVCRRCRQGASSPQRRG